MTFPVRPLCGRSWFRGWSAVSLVAALGADVASVRHFDGPSATARWGICCGHGVIYISTLNSKGSP